MFAINCFVKYLYRIKFSRYLLGFLPVWNLSYDRTLLVPDQQARLPWFWSVPLPSNVGMLKVRDAAVVNEDLVALDPDIDSEKKTPNWIFQFVTLIFFRILCRCFLLCLVLICSQDLGRRYLKLGMNKTAEGVAEILQDQRPIGNYSPAVTFFLLNLNAVMIEKFIF